MNNMENKENIIVGLKEIMDLIPHRYPFLLVDRVEEFVKNESAVGIKNVTINEPFFQGHFPVRPIMPGVLIVEAMGQTAGVIVAKTLNLENSGGLVYFMSMDGIKFRKLVEPGDVLHLCVCKEKSHGNVWRFNGKAYVDNTLVAEAIFTAMIVLEDKQ